jgi:hypothetical protein
VLLLVILWGKTSRTSYLWAAGIVGGLSLGIHTLVALAAPAVLVYLFLKRPNRKAWKAALLGGALGFLIFALSFLALDAHNDITGMPANFRVHASAYGLQPEDFDSSWTRISFIFFSRQWRAQMFSGSSEDISNNITTYVERTWGTFSFAGFFLALIGTLGLFANKPDRPNRWREGILLLGSWLGMMYFLANYRVGDLEVFFIPVYAILAVFLSEGFIYLADGIYQFLRAFHLRKSTGIALAGLTVVGICLWSAWPTLDLARKSIQQGRIAFLDESRIYYPYPVMDPGYPYREAQKIADLVEDDSILFIGWDLLYPVCYVAHVEQKRGNIACYEPMPFGTDGRMASSALKLIRANIDLHPIYFSQIPDDMKGLYKFRQVGWSYPLYKLSKR